MTTSNSEDNTQIQPDSNREHNKTVLPDSEINADPLIGRRIGNYQVLSVLGHGGFGSVYKAEDTKLGRNVALKFLNQATEGFHAELFEREAKALGILSKHPHIVQIHSWDEFEGKNFFVLEYMESSVADLLEKYPEGMPVDLSVRMLDSDIKCNTHAFRGCLIVESFSGSIVEFLGDGIQMAVCESA